MVLGLLLAWDENPRSAVAGGNLISGSGELAPGIMRATLATRAAQSLAYLVGAQGRSSPGNLRELSDVP